MNTVSDQTIMIPPNCISIYFQQLHNCLAEVTKSCSSQHNDLKLYISHVTFHFTHMMQDYLCCCIHMSKNQSAEPKNLRAFNTGEV